MTLRSWWGRFVRAVRRLWPGEERPVFYSDRPHWRDPEVEARYLRRIKHPRPDHNLTWEQMARIGNRTNDEKMSEYLPSITQVPGSTRGLAEECPVCGANNPDGTHRPRCPGAPTDSAVPEPERTGGEG